MNIEKLIQDAILTGAPVRLRDGRKAVVVADILAAAKTLGTELRDFEICVQGYFLGTASDWGEGILNRISWLRDGTYCDGSESARDIVGPWLEFIYWEALVPEIRYIAMSDNGEWHGFTEEPVEFNGAWVTDPACFVLDALAGLPKLDPSLWQYSLLKRPQGVYHGR